MNGAINVAFNGAKERTHRLRKVAGLFALIAVLIISIAVLTGCGTEQPSEQDDVRIRIVTTIFPPYDFARAIAGDETRADITMLLSPGEEIHSYEPTPMDIKKIQNSDLFIYIGGENDVWVDRILENMGDKKPQTLRLVDLTDTVAEEVVEGMMEERGGHEHDHEAEHAEGAEHDLEAHAEEAEHGHEAEHAEEAEHGHEAEHAEEAEHDHEAEHAEEAEHDHEDADDHAHSSHTHSGDSSEEEHEEADEHVWTSPVKAAEITEAIAAKMAEIDPDNAESYLANANAYVKKILEVDAAYREIVDNAERRTIVFGDRFPLRYFAEEYGLEYFAAFPGCSSESEPSASTLAFLIDKVREEQIPVVFSIEFSNGNIARAICESSGAVQRTFNSCHNVTRAQMENGATYVSLMTENLEPVREALGDKRAVVE